MNTPRLRLRPDPPEAWRNAISNWTQGNDRYLLRLLAEDDRPIPTFARKWIADALAGKVKRKRGRRPPSLADVAAKLIRDSEVRQYFDIRLLIEQAAEGEIGTPSERALDATAERFGIGADAVSHIVRPRKARNSGE